MLEFIDRHPDFAGGLALAIFFLLLVIIVRTANLIEGVARARGAFKDEEPKLVSRTITTTTATPDDDDGGHRSCVRVH